MTVSFIGLCDEGFVSCDSEKHMQEMLEPDRGRCQESHATAVVGGDSLVEELREIARSIQNVLSERVV